MKLLIKSMLGLAAAVLMGGSASAATQTLLIVGSTAYRAPATAAIVNYLQTHGGVCYGTSDKSNTASASNLFGANHGLFINASSIGAATIIIETNWTGSAAGLIDLATANATQDQFISTSSTVSQINVSASEYGTFNTAPTLVTEVPNMSFVDSFDTSVAATFAGATVTGTIAPGVNTGPTLANALQAGNVQYAGTSAGAGNQDAVGIIPFSWYIGNYNSTTYPAGFTNVTQEAASAAIGGVAGLNLFTGVASDSANNVYTVGRNEDSGTRLCEFAESQLGFGPGCDQFELSFSGTSTTGKLTLASGTISTLPTGGVGATVTSGVDFESDAQTYTEPKVGWGLSGHSGYASGGDVASVLLAYNPVTNVNIDGSVNGNTYFIGYLGWSDGYALMSPGNVAGVAGPVNGHSTGTYLTYNGVAPTVANIENGTFTCWAYEHLYYLTSGTNAIGSNKSAADGLADAVFASPNWNSSGVLSNTDPTNSVSTSTAPAGGIPYNSMNVSRGQEGGVITDL